jgi:hypothetical protein
MGQKRYHGLSAAGHLKKTAKYIKPYGAKIECPRVPPD